MRTAIRLWITAIATGLWLVFAQSAHATDIRGCHVLPGKGLQPPPLVSQLPKTKLAQLKVIYVANQLKAPEHQQNKLSRVSRSSSLDDFKRAIAANPDNPTAWNNLGQVFFVLGQHVDALLAYNHALLINPNYSLALANRCGVLSQLEDYTQALKSCNLAIKGDGHWGAQGSALAWDNRGDALFKLEQYQESLASFEQALVINPHYQNAWRNRAVVLSQVEHIKE